MLESSGGTAWKRRAGGFVVFAATLTLLLATEPRLAIVWDEGYTLGRIERVRAWIRAVREPSTLQSWDWSEETDLIPDGTPPPPFRTLNARSKLFHSAAMTWFWPFGREEPHGHPPFYAIVGLIGDLLTPGREELARARLGPMLAFSLVSGALFTFLTRRLGAWPAMLGVAAWVGQPRLFAHAHYASYDALLTSLWAASILSFVCAVEPTVGSANSPVDPRPRWGWAVVFGILAGWAADTKLTGWFLPLPFLAWTLLYRDRRGMRTLLVGGVVGLVTLFAFNPPWWVDPVGGVVRFFGSNLTRDKTITITVQFLGKVYATPRESLPWYNTLVWTALVTPVGFLAFSMLGLGTAFRNARREPFGLLMAGHWLFLLLLRALPHTPGHDGERQFLPAFGCLALVASLGASALFSRFRSWARWLIVAAILEGFFSVAYFMPVPLSYYSPIVGGLPGATALGMEPTYYWDSLDAETLDWLNSHTRPGEKVAFATQPTIWLHLQKTGRLTRKTGASDPGRFAWYVVQNRTGDFSRVDRALIQMGRWTHIVRKAGVPLIYIFPHAEWEACKRIERRQLQQKR